MSRKNENKKGANGAGSIRKITTTHNGKEYTYWQGRYTEGYDACTGKQIQRSITGKTPKLMQRPMLLPVSSAYPNGCPYGHRITLSGSRLLPHTFTGAPLSYISTRISVTSVSTH